MEPGLGAVALGRVVEDLDPGRLEIRPHPVHVVDDQADAIRSSNASWSTSAGP
jgi:hypothetical protein